MATLSLVMNTKPYKYNYSSFLNHDHKMNTNKVSIFKKKPLPVSGCRTRMSKQEQQRQTTPASDRIISAMSYTVPFLNSLNYGRLVLAGYPWVSSALVPLMNVYRSVPYAPLMAFFGVYMGVVRNPSLSNYVRFNGMQALTLDLLLLLPLLLTRIFSPLPSNLLLWAHTAVFLFATTCFLYALLSSLLGITPYLPFVADAASTQF